jgi:hypothetical protein
MAMDRNDSRRVSQASWLSFAALLALHLAGCASALSTMLYVIDPNDRAAEYKGLKGKRVAVVCRPPADIGFRDANVDQDLARQVGRQLREHVRGIKLIDADEVAQWTDENSWDDFAEIGQALKADIVLGIDLESFTLYQHQTLYQGKSNLRLRVYDLTGGKSDLVYDKFPPQSIYPPNTGIATQDMPEAEFRRQYIGELATEVARHFHKYESRADFAKDSAALK